MDLYNFIKNKIKGTSDEKMSVSIITMEDAKVLELNNTNFNDIKSKIEKSCLSISKEVKRLSSKQTEIMNEIIKDLDKKKSDRSI